MRLTMGVCAATLASLPAFAQQQAMAEPELPRGMCERGYVAADGDGDGRVSEAEAAAAAGEEFAAMDADGDGALTRDEHIACLSSVYNEAPAPSDRTETNIDVADDDGDGTVSAREYWRTAHMAHQRAQDARGMGSEAQVLLRRIVFIPASEPNTDVDGRSQAETAAAAGRLFVLLDTDGSGDLSVGEWADAAPETGAGDWAAARFRRMDADGSGQVTEAQYLEAASAARAAARQEAADTSYAIRDGIVRLLPEGTEPLGPDVEGDATQDSAAPDNPPAVFYRFERAF